MLYAACIKQLLISSKIYGKYLRVVWTFEELEKVLDIKFENIDYSSQLKSIMKEIQTQHKHIHCHVVTLGKKYIPTNDIFLLFMYLKPVLIIVV